MIYQLLHCILWNWWRHLTTVWASSECWTKNLCTGIVTSPDYCDAVRNKRQEGLPGNCNYPNNHEKTKTIETKPGLLLLLKFNGFDIEDCPMCSCDHLTITDGDGTILMKKSCGSEGDLVIGDQQKDFKLPPNIMSRSNRVNFAFVTDDSDQRPGWSVSWSAVTPPPPKPSPPGERPFLASLQ